ncbi:hypothetical protein [Hufsiella ginkgonis]|uniref:Uncharacterized protein n=1 Tax=Hufsiella ginkgonis TaxID=2695274 RepID=A0A7K1XV03_9SPHI|nr:hypothetical protein [Hufsiella ginkgonis]MXV14800.1 hypothetical protein [Hufsiella ginkgonis]
MWLVLKGWRTNLLFAPGVAGLILLGYGFPGLTYHDCLAVFNLSVVINLVVVILVHTYVALQFNKAIKNKSLLFNINAILPLVTLAAYLVYCIAFTVATLTGKGEARVFIPGDHTIGKAILFATAHGLLNFFFINNRYVSVNIRNNDDEWQQVQYRKEFLLPMKRLVRLSLYIGAICLLATLIKDISTLF